MSKLMDSLVVYKSNENPLQNRGLRKWNKMYSKHKLIPNTLKYETIQFFRTENFNSEKSNPLVVKRLNISRGYCLHLRRFSAIKFPLSLLGSQKSIKTEYRFQLTFFHLTSKTFFGRTFKSEDQTSTKRITKTSQNLVENVSFEDTIMFFHTSIVDPNVVLVCELIGMVSKNDVIVKEFSVGFSLLNLFDTINYGRKETYLFSKYYNFDDGHVKKNAPSKSRSIFSGTPRMLLFTPQNELHPILGSSVEFCVFRHKKLDSAISPNRFYLLENDIYDENDDVPGMKKIDIVDDEGGYQIPSFESPVFQSQVPIKINTLCIDIPRDFEGKLLGDLERLRSDEQRELIINEGNVEIIARKIKVGVHNTCTFVSEVKEVNLEVSRSARTETALQTLQLAFKGSLNFEKFFDHPMCGMVFELQYDIKIPSPMLVVEKKKFFRKTKMKVRPEKGFVFQTIAVGYYVFLPFYRNRSVRGISRPMIIGVSGKRIRSFFDKLLYIPNVEDPFMLKFNISGLNKNLQSWSKALEVEEDEEQPVDESEVYDDEYDNEEEEEPEIVPVENEPRTPIVKKKKKKKTVKIAPKEVESPPIEKKQPNMSHKKPIGVLTKTNEKTSTQDRLGGGANQTFDVLNSSKGKPSLVKLSLSFKNLKTKGNQLKKISNLQIFQGLSMDDKGYLEKGNFLPIIKEEEKKMIGESTKLFQPLLSSFNDITQSKLPKKPRKLIFKLQFLTFSPFSRRDLPTHLQFKIYFHTQKKHSDVLELPQNQMTNERPLVLSNTNTERDGSIVTFTIDENELEKEQYEEFVTLFLGTSKMLVEIYNFNSQFQFGYFYIPLTLFPGIGKKNKNSFAGKVCTFNVFGGLLDEKMEVLHKGKVLMKLFHVSTASNLDKNQKEISKNLFEKQGLTAMQNQEKIMEKVEKKAVNVSELRMDRNNIKEYVSMHEFFREKMKKLKEKRLKKESESKGNESSVLRSTYREYKKVYVSRGKSSYIHVSVSNFTKENSKFLVCWEDQKSSVKSKRKLSSSFTIPNDTKEMAFFRNYSNRLFVRKGKNEFVCDAMESNESVLITLKYFSIEDHEEGEERSIVLKIINQTKGIAVKEVVILISYTSHFINENVQFYQKENEIFSRKVRSNESCEFMLLHENSGKVKIGKTGERNSFELMCSTEKPNNTIDMYLFFYTDKFFSSLLEIWKVSIVYVKRLEIKGTCGESNELVLKNIVDDNTKIFNPNSKIWSFSSNRNLLSCMLNSHERSTQVNLMQLKYKVMSETTESALIHLVDEQNRICDRFLVSITPLFERENKKFVTKTYPITLTKKTNVHYLRIHFTNESDFTEFTVRNSREELCVFVRESFTARTGEKVSLDLKLLQPPGENRLEFYVFVNDKKRDKTCACYSMDIGFPKAK